MASIISAGNATNGLAVSSDNTGILELKTGSGAGTTALTISTAQAATFASTVTSAQGTLYPLTSGTAVSASGTSVTFTGIPSWAKRITVLFSGLSMNGASTNSFVIRLGTSGGVETTSYASSMVYAQASGTSAGSSNTTGFLVYAAGSTNLIDGAMTIALLDSANNTWVSYGGVALSGQNYAGVSAGKKSLSDVLTRVQIATANGTDTFDAGTINIIYEG